MNFFEKIVCALQFEMERPTTYGLFHICWLVASIGLILFLALRKEKNHERTLKVILLVYGIGAFLLELTKQIIWSYNFDPATGIGTWDYQWYAAPFQLCTTPIFTCIAAAFMKKGALRDSLLAYTAFVTILGSVATALYPEACFVRTVLVDVHTMYLHFGSLVVSVYLICSKEIAATPKNLFRAWIVFAAFAATALAMDLIFYHSGVIGDETFNMFYISPYFISALPVFDSIWTWANEKGLYLVYLFLYLFAMCAGSGVIWLIAKAFTRKNKEKISKNT